MKVSCLQMNMKLGCPEENFAHAEQLICNAMKDNADVLVLPETWNTGFFLNFEVSGEKIEAVHMLPGYTHNIINLSDTEDLVTVMWANEQFDPNKPDTFFEEV